MLKIKHQIEEEEDEERTFRRYDEIDHTNSNDIDIEPIQKKRKLSTKSEWSSKLNKYHKLMQLFITRN